MKIKNRLILALCTLAIGLVASDATSQVNNKRCFFNISCGDNKAPCVNPPANSCEVCTGTTVGNFCFPFYNSNCLGLSATACGLKYNGACLSLCHTCPKLCIALTLVGQCSATRCL